MFQRRIFKFGVLLLMFLAPLIVNAQRGEKIRTIVIDPGHGGKDTGALGKSSKEKDLNLAVALKLGNFIKQNLPDVKVIYTRSRDVFIPLAERAAIANRNDADVFISIHCNSTEGTTTVSGAETFVMGEHKSAANLEVAKKENASILYEDNAAEEYDGFDPNNTKTYIIFSLFQSQYQLQSLDLADKVQQQFRDRVGRNDRGVRQAGFLVLYKTSMPSILVELGFINNLKEEKYLKSEEGQSQMASAIYRAFKEYKTAYEKENVSVSMPAEQPEKQETPPTKQDEAVSQNEVVFKVQFASDSSRNKRFPKVKEVGVYEFNNAYRYTSGNFATRDEAVNRQNELCRHGYSDVFVIAFVNGERASLKQAEELRPVGERTQQPHPPAPP